MMMTSGSSRRRKSSVASKPWSRILTDDNVRNVADIARSRLKFLDFDRVGVEAQDFVTLVDQRSRQW